MASLPSYVAEARPVPAANRIPWYKSIAPTYAGIMLWFVFWHDVPVGSGLHQDFGQFSAFAGGTLAQGLGVAILGLILAALICHFLFYLVPGMLGMKTGLPLYIVGTSTYGVQGGFLMPGFLMGLLQFGWLAVNAYFAGILLCAPWNQGPGTTAHALVATVWAVAAALVGLKGIQYVARVATLLPLIPLAILVILTLSVLGGVGNFNPESAIEAGRNVQVQVQGQELSAQAPLTTWGVVALLCTYVVGFFATAGAAGTDIAMNSRNAGDVQRGGLVGIALATIVAGGLSLVFVAGAYGKGTLPGDAAAVLRATGLMGAGVGDATAKVFMYLLAIAAFPAACFSSLIAANSFKTTLPRTNPLITVGLGTAAAVFLAVTGYAGNAIGVFTLIGASFGPVCGAMAADYLLAGRQWSGPRGGFNPAGWISWAAGFVVGAANFIPALKGQIPVPPVAAFVVGFVLYAVLTKIGLTTRTLEMPRAGR